MKKQNPIIEKKVKNICPKSASVYFNAKNIIIILENKIDGSNGKLYHSLKDKIFSLINKMRLQNDYNSVLIMG